MATVVMDQRPAAGGKAPRSRKARGTTSPTTGVAPSKRSVSGRNRVSFTSDQVILSFSLWWFEWELWKKQHEMYCILSWHSFFPYGIDVFSFKCFHLQLDDMEHVFQMTQYPDVTILEALAIRLQLPIEKICVSVHRFHFVVNTWELFVW